MCNHATKSVILPLECMTGACNTCACYCEPLDISTLTLIDVILLSPIRCDLQRPVPNSYLLQYLQLKYLLKLYNHYDFIYKRVSSFFTLWYNNTNTTEAKFCKAKRLQTVLYVTALLCMLMGSDFMTFSVSILAKPLSKTTLDKVFIRHKNTSSSVKFSIRISV